MSFALLKALELCACYQGWLTTYNDIIIGRLWPLIQRSQDMEPKMVFAILLIGTLGRIGLAEETNSPTTEQSGLEYLRKRFVDVLAFSPPAEASKELAEEPSQGCKSPPRFPSFFFFFFFFSIRINLFLFLFQFPFGFNSLP